MHLPVNCDTTLSSTSPHNHDIHPSHSTCCPLICFQPSYVFLCMFFHLLQFCFALHPGFNQNITYNPSSYMIGVCCYTLTAFMLTVTFYQSYTCIAKHVWDLHVNIMWCGSSRTHWDKPTFYTQEILLVQNSRLVTRLKSVMVTRLFKM